MISALAATAAGCHSGPAATPECIWGRRGVSPGDLVRPRPAAILPDDHIYIVDFTARIQGYTADGKYLGHTWTTPDFRNGRPSGLAVTRAGQLLVCDSHYHTLRVYDGEGKELFTRGGEA